MTMPYRVMKATLAERLPPDDDRWAYEVKWDGMRVLAEVDAHDDDADATIRLWSGAGNEATDRFPEIAPLADALRPHTAVLDGEIVAFDPAGRPDFGRLQPRMAARSAKQTAAAAAGQAVTYVLFDLLELDGHDLTGQAYEDRHRLLALLVEAGSHWIVTDSWTGGGAALLATMDATGMEGLIAKRLGSRYEPGRRSTEWRKIKVRRRQELVVGGWLPGQGERSGTFGSLLVGYHDTPGSASLVYAGRVGSGIARAEQERLVDQLGALATDRCPFGRARSRAGGELPAAVARDGRWVRPELVVEVAFGEWTTDGVLRHPVYAGQRFDCDATAVVRESPRPWSSGAPG